MPGPVSGRRVLAAVGIGLAGELSALGLLATGGWLLLSASLRPPILLLSIAIGAVQLFSLLRGTARYAERLASHDLGLRCRPGCAGGCTAGCSTWSRPGCPAGTAATCWPGWSVTPRRPRISWSGLRCRCWPRCSPGSRPW